MKLSLIIFGFLFSSFMKTTDPSTETVCGIWKGYYGTEKVINTITIKINPQNKAEILYNYNDALLRTKATYKLIGDSEIIISGLPAEQPTSEIILHGNLNRTARFIDGKWDDKGKTGGCFYLQKQFPEMNY